MGLGQDYGLCHAKVFQNFLESCHTNLTLIIHIGCHFEFRYQLVPLGTDFLENTAESARSLVSMQLVVQQTVVLALLGRLETLIVLTNYDLALLGHVLPEVQALGREHF